MNLLLPQTNAYRIVKSEAEQNLLAHAYLLVFPDGKFLRDALKEFAKLVLQADSRAAELIDKEFFSDCKIYPESGKRLTVDCISSLLEDCKLLPVEGDKKLYILSDFHDASASVQNKLLKVLEEPPQGVYFLLGTTGEFPILPTVLSRVRKISVEPFSSRQVLSFLTRRYPERQDLSDYAVSSSGVLSQAVALAEGGYYDEMRSLCEKILSMKETDLPFLSAKASSFKQKSEFLSLLRLVFRDLLMYNSNGTPLLRSFDLKPFVSDYNATACVAILEGLSEAERDVKFNASPALLMENLLITIYKEKEKCLKS